MSISFDIVLVSLFLLILLLVIFIFLVYRRDQIIYKHIPLKSLTMTKFDLNRRKYLFEEKSNQHRKIFKSTQVSSWTNFADLVNEFDIKIRRQFAEVLSKLEKGSEHETISFGVKSFHYHNRISDFKFTWHKIDGETDYFLITQYNVRPKLRKLSYNRIYKLTNEQLLKQSGSKLYKGFIAFNIIGNLEQSVGSILRMLSAIWKVKRINYFIKSGLLIIVVSGKNNLRTSEKIEKVAATIKKKGYFRGIKKYFHGSASVISQKTTSNKYINQIIQTINFLINLSIYKKEEFLTQSNDLDRDEFTSYIEASKIFYKLIANKKIKSKNVAVRNWQTNKKIVNYIYPSIPSLNSMTVSSILRNENNKRLLVNKHAESVAFVKPKKQTPALLDVYDYWFIENYSKILNTNIMYVIHFNKYKPNKEFIDLFNTLNKKNIPYAVHVNDYDESTAYLIQTFKPRFLVQDNSAWNKEGLINSNTYMKLMTIASLARENDIKIIYQDPSTIIDKDTAEKIGLIYYYNKAKN